MASEDENKKADPGEKKGESSKWWEIYAVRYFVGTVIGGIVVYILNAQAGSPFFGFLGAKNTIELSAQVVSVLGALGLAICYISSAPILVLHATRGVFLRAAPSHFESWYFGAFIGVAFLTALLLYICGVSPDHGGALWLLVLVLYMQLVPILFALPRRGQAMHDYYKRLTAARVNQSPAAKQYIESYRHLREHGNAFLIVLFEALFGLIVWLYPSPLIAFLVALVWITPAGLVWCIAMLLEFRFSVDFEKS